jgi:hypothetical protein
MEGVAEGGDRQSATPNTAASSASAASSAPAASSASASRGHSYTHAALCTTRALRWADLVRRMWLGASVRCLACICLPPLFTVDHGSQRTTIHSGPRFTAAVATRRHPCSPRIHRTPFASCLTPPTSHLPPLISHLLPLTPCLSLPRAACPPPLALHFAGFPSPRDLLSPSKYAAPRSSHALLHRSGRVRHHLLQTCQTCEMWVSHKGVPSPLSHKVPQAPIRCIQHS